ncbi:MAG: hypothetical protein LRY54_00245 [Alphaproteobacteria bacterium]|nr:hypothetical protein [Alphaproteobacteria bacterium]
MSYKDTFEKALLKTTGKDINDHAGDYHGYRKDPRLKFMLHDLMAAGLARIVEKSKWSTGESRGLFEISDTYNALGMAASIKCLSGYQKIEFACPQDDKNKLFVTIYNLAYIGKSYVYDYTGNIEAANDRLVEWLVEAAPDYGLEIAAVLDKIENKPEMRPVTIFTEPQVMIIDRPQVVTPATGAHIQAGPARDPV